jgi:peptidoglycan/xylan/chitin deacetylase (PgdA/CDA1 family)
MYHRVISGVTDPWGLCVSPENFNQHLQVLRRFYRLVTLSQLATGHTIQSRMVALTFDDGYADNFHHALPLLTRNNVPATFFLTSGMLGATCEFWWDELERLLLGPQFLPPKIELTIGSNSRAFEAGSAARSFCGPHVEIVSTRPWKAAATTRVGFYYVIWQWLKTLDSAARRAALAQIRSQLGETEVTRGSHRTLTRAEAILLAGAPHIDIGAHSVTHASLPTLPSHAQRWEMHQSKCDLEGLTGRAVAAFAYPFGEYASETPALAKDIGFKFACTTKANSVTRNTKPFLLPRLDVPDCDGAQFARFLAEAL